MADTNQSERELMESLRRGDRVIAIHYACDNFFSAKDQPVAVSSIACSEATNSGDIRSESVFSLANSTTSSNDGATQHDREKLLLERFYDYISKVPDARFVHWNMNKATYGFAAIRERYHYLFEEYPAHSFPEDRLFDLDSIIGVRFGANYVDHPKLRKICDLNGYWMPFFKTGTEEVSALESGDYGLIERSTAQKANLIAKLLMEFSMGRLKTKDSVGSVAFAGGHVDAVRCVEAIGDRFRDIERELKRRHNGRQTLEVGDEYDAQDLVRALLRLFFGDVRPEDCTPSYAGGNSRVDFLIPDFELAVELKFTRMGMKDRDVGAQLLIDRDRYASNLAVRHLACLVFDHDGFLANPRGLEKDLSRSASSDGLSVTVRIYDR